MKKVVTVVIFASVLIGSLVSCGSSKHAGKCDAYSMNKRVKLEQDLAKK